MYVFYFFHREQVSELKLFPLNGCQGESIRYTSLHFQCVCKSTLLNVIISLHPSLFMHRFR